MNTKYYSNNLTNIYTLGFVFCGVGRRCDPLRLMSYALLYTTSRESIQLC